jgi:hypothetical protein
MDRQARLFVAPLFLALALAGCSSTQVAVNNAAADPALVGSAPTDIAYLPADEETKPPRKPKKQRVVTVTLQPTATGSTTAAVATPTAAAAGQSATTLQSTGAMAVPAAMAAFQSATTLQATATDAVAAPAAVAAFQRAAALHPTATSAVAAPAAVAVFPSADPGEIDPALEAGRERAARRSDEQMRKWDAIARRALASVCRRC